MMCAHKKDIAIVIPARNEGDRIGACLIALAGQCTARVTVIVVVNNTVDRTSDTARDIASRHGLSLVVLNCTFAPDEGVGTARRMGCDHALQNMPDLQYLLATDADCIVAADWVVRNLAHLEMVDAVCGKIELIADETSVLDDMDPHLADLEGRYRELVQKFYARHAPGCADIDGTHGEAAGASLAFSKEAYLAVGGFAAMVCGEDRRIVRTLREAGRKVRHAQDVRVHASCRLTGRAVGGMSDAIKARVRGMDYMIDDCLPPADWLVRHADSQTLGLWPPLVPTGCRLNVRELKLHIEILENFLNSGRLIPALMPPAAVAPCSHIRTLQPNGGSAIVPANLDLQAFRIPEDRLSATPQTNASSMPTAKGA